MQEMLVFKKKLFIKLTEITDINHYLELLGKLWKNFQPTTYMCKQLFSIKNAMKTKT